MADFHTYAKDMSPESQQEAERIAQQEAVSKAMFMQSQSRTAPPPYMGRRRMIVPPAGPNAFAQIAEGLMSHVMDERNKADKAALMEKDKQQVADALGAYQTQFKGAPENAPSDGMGPTRPPVAADPRGAIAAAITSQQPLVKTLAAHQEAELNRTEAAKQKQQDKLDQMDAAKALKVDKSIPEDWKKHLPAGTKPGLLAGQYVGRDGDEVQMNFEDGKFVGSKNINPMPSNRNPDGSVRGGAAHPTTIADPNDPNKTIVVDANTGRKIGDGPKLSQVGSAEQKLELNLPAARQHVEMVNQNIDKLDAALADLNKTPGLENITGTIAGRTWNLTNTATGAQAKLNHIKSNIFTSSLQAMREASKTGGAVGNVSDKEGDKLERTLAALDQAQSTEDFKKNILKAQEQLKTSKAIIQRAFDDQYGGVQSRNPPAAPGGGEGWTPAKQQRLDELRRKANGSK